MAKRSLSKRRSDIIGPKPPSNRLVQYSPADTISRCRQVINWLAHIEQPFGEGYGGELAAGEAEILLLVTDALEHAETTVQACYRLDDDPEGLEIAQEAAEAKEAAIEGSQS